jgi:Transmembrane secretion effector
VTPRHRDFGLLWTGQTISEVGTRTSRVAVPLVAVTALAATPWQMGLLTAAGTAAFLLVGLPAGAVLDRVRRRPVMVAADVLRCALFAAVPLAWSLGGLSFPLLVAVVLAAGVATVFFDVGYQSVLPAVIGRGGLVAGNARLETTRSAAAAAGPALGGGLVQLVGAATAVLVDAASYLVSAVLLGRMRTGEPRPEPTGRSLRADVAEGLRFALTHPLLRPIALCTATSNLFAGVLDAVAVLYLSSGLGLSPGALGLVLGAGALGGVIGAITAAPVIARLGLGRTVVAALLVTAPFAGLLCTGSAGLYAAGLVVVLFGTVVYNVAQVSFRQAICPDRLLGRMNASLRFLSWGVVPLGGLLGGALGELVGLRATLAVAAVGFVVAPMWLVASPVRDLRDLPAGEPG